MSRMRILLLQIDGKMPNVALMRIASHCRAIGHNVSLRKGNLPHLWDRPDRIYASAIFEKSRPLIEELLREQPSAIVGGTGWDTGITLEQHGIETRRQDYADYPEFRQSIGFTQRGCRMKCSFCVVPQTEGAVREEQTINDIWRGEHWPRHVILLDNDFFGQPRWRDRIGELNDGGFAVSFNQGVNARIITDEQAAAIASTNYRDDGMKVKRLYTAWDTTSHERAFFRGLRRLADHGVKPDNIMVYMLIGYAPDETVADWLYRRDKLREFGARPYPMPYRRTFAAVGFQRWIVGAYDKRVAWEGWSRANYLPRRLDRGAGGGDA